MYSVSVADNSADGSSDSFTISLSNGYSASGALTSGDIRIQWVPEERRKIQELEATITQLKSGASRQEQNVAQQQKQIEALSAGLQKVSAQLEASKPEQQMLAKSESHWRSVDRTLSFNWANLGRVRSLLVSNPNYPPLLPGLAGQQIGNFLPEQSDHCQVNQFSEQFGNG
jgi:hypothetical protein